MPAVDSLSPWRKIVTVPWLGRWNKMAEQAPVLTFAAKGRERTVALPKGCVEVHTTSKRNVYVRLVACRLGCSPTLIYLEAHDDRLVSFHLELTVGPR